MTAKTASMKFLFARLLPACALALSPWFSSAARAQMTAQYNVDVRQFQVVRVVQSKADDDPVRVGSLVEQQTATLRQAHRTAWHTRQLWLALVTGRAATGGG
jgi:hypothetical protein